MNGEGTSGITSLIQPVVESAGLPMTCHPCASPTLTEKGLKWFFRTGPNDKTMVASVFTFLHEWRDKGGPANLKTIAFFMCDNLFCQDNRKVASELAPKAGFQVVLDLTSKTGATTLASEVQRLQAANPDVLFLVQYTVDTSVFQNDARRAGWSPEGDRHQQRRLLRRNVTAGAEENQRWRRLARARPDRHRPRARSPELEEGQRDLQEV
ncbi:MAG TPA: ABC transporter substrate-binding protein [Methylomirabilota bacterium]|nr:ABC transporter substrate-binding protein [Methylomirabilota bacterium]